MTTLSTLRVDQLFEKHEYMSYERHEASRLEVDVAGSKVSRLEHSVRLRELYFQPAGIAPGVNWCALAI
jgi:hypothetical protein